MHIMRDVVTEAPVRIGATLAIALAALLATLLVLRPDMMGLGMGMAHRLIVGFGL